jgi:hypothetical protein
MGRVGLFFGPHVLHMDLINIRLILIRQVVRLLDLIVVSLRLCSGLTGRVYLAEGLPDITVLFFPPD